MFEIPIVLWQTFLILPKSSWKIDLVLPILQYARSFLFWRVQMLERLVLLIYRWILEVQICIVGVQPASRWILDEYFYHLSTAHIVHVVLLLAPPAWGSLEQCGHQLYSGNTFPSAVWPYLLLFTSILLLSPCLQMQHACHFTLVLRCKRIVHGGQSLP